jgi:outer membrane protein assembly factor BamB
VIINDRDKESIITSIADANDGFVMVGSVKNANYRLLLMKTNKKMEKLWTKSFGANSTDFEGQDIAPIKDGFIICGCSEGHASESGGSDWKVYVSRIDHDGNLVWEKSYRIKGNECAYSLVADENIFVFGETSSTPQERYLFLMKLDANGDLIWHKIFEMGQEVTPGGLLKEGRDYIIIGSFKRNDMWNTSLKKTDGDGKILMEETFGNANIYGIRRAKDGYLMTGSKDEHFYLLKTDGNGRKAWDKTYERGCGVAIEKSGDSLMVGGDIRKNESSLPALYKIDQDGTAEWCRTYGKGGFIETLKQHSDGFILVRHILTPKECTEITEVDENGLLRQNKISMEHLREDNGG